MSPNSIRILASRRAYEFRPDDLRLSLICTVPARDAIQNLFSFASAQIATPMAIFGDVAQTIPPGAVFNFGFITLEEGKPTPIRLLHFEPTRLVIDVAGTSDAIDQVYARISELLSDLQGPDGTAAIGEPIRTMDYSEATVHLAGEPSRLLSPTLLDALVNLRVFPENQVPVPAIRIAMQALEEVYPGSSITATAPPAVILEIRVGTAPEEGAFFSGAAVDTEIHTAYLSKLADSFTT
jgi:hypothetical protein